MSTTPIDTERFSRALRARGVDLNGQRVLIAKFDGSRQASDLTMPPNCGGFGRLHHFHIDQGAGWPRNPLPNEPAAYRLGYKMEESVRVQVFQNAICSWRCWYCFVDFDLLSANPRFSEFKTADELLDLFLAEADRPRIIDLSGGQPDLVPEWGVWFAEALQRRGIAEDYFLWSDDNLSNDYLWRHLTSQQRNTLMQFTNYARVGCFKGFDERSFSFNTRADASKFNQQFDLMRRLAEVGFDVYGYATFTGPSNCNIASSMRRFVDLLQERVHPLFPLRTVPLRIRSFTPMLNRLSAEDCRAAMSIQQEAVAAWQEELDVRFEQSVRARPIHEHHLV